MRRGVTRAANVGGALVVSTVHINEVRGVSCVHRKGAPPLVLRLGCGFCRGAVCSLLGGAVNVRGNGFFPATNTTMPSRVYRFIRSINVSVLMNCKLARSATAISYASGANCSVNSMNRIVPSMRIGVKRSGRVLLHKGAVAGKCCGGTRTATTAVSTSK